MSIKEQLSTNAARAIGAYNPKKDWEFNLKENIEAIADKDKAAPLIRILTEDDQIKQIAKDYDKNDKTALEWQSGYERWGRIAIATTFLATVIGALYVFPFGQTLEQPGYKVVLIIAEVIIFAIIMASRGWLGVKKHHKKYREARTMAEDGRFTLFDRLFAIDPDDKTLLPLKLEFYRRFLFMAQLDYYRNAQNKNLFRAKRAKIVRNAGRAVYYLAILAALPAALFVLQKGGYINWMWLDNIRESWLFLPHFSQMADKYLLGIGIITSAVHTLTTEDTRLHMASRNAHSFELAARFLEAQRDKRLPQVRAAADNGDEAAVDAFIEETNNELKEEHQDWALAQEYKGRTL